MDFAAKIEALREMRETTPPCAAVPGASGKRMKSRVADVKKAKETEFKVEPEGMEEKLSIKKISKK